MAAGVTFFAAFLAAGLALALVAFFLEAFFAFAAFFALAASAFACSFSNLAMAFTLPATDLATAFASLNHGNLQPTTVS